jgi:hypothetical protein
LEGNGAGRIVPFGRSGQVDTRMPAPTNGSSQFEQWKVWRQEGRTSFLKKRSKKLLQIWLRRLRGGSAQTRKSFLVLFFKKAPLSA